ncbi:hypothetical protein AVEN_57464-1 [Araneus ventricosus]|uniref:Glucose-methanol-choline oxidoreductase N-terminal domain-containing protein n=1 Tax=Araneus ventricosus TaxID=182803 RepID=A0A4Y2CWS4_ARAVE|nr:hypothetical protein AVEN_57464-1 [Araneus ventricosus]
MLYVRGNKRDYDQWADNGGRGWSWNGVYSYFLKAENNTDPEIANNGYHSTGGFLTVSTPPQTNALKEAFAAAASEIGYEYRDINGEKQTGNREDSPPVKSYGCGTPDFIRVKSPNCPTEPKVESSRFKYLEASFRFVTTAPVSTVYLRVNGIFGKACVDTGSSHSIAGEALYTLLKDEGAKFRNGTMCISLADGQHPTENALITTVTLQIEGRNFDKELIALPNAKTNRTLLGNDFLKRSGIMLDLKNQQWFFNNMPRKKFAFVEQLDRKRLPYESWNAVPLLSRF